MRNGDRKLKVYGWCILKNGWEYYFIDDKHYNDIRDALVMGFETEVGAVSVKEIQPYMLSYIHGKQLNDIQPPPQWVWE